MLYKCHCDVFNAKNNNYIEISKKIIINKINYAILNLNVKNNNQNKLLISIFFIESGGLQNEYDIISKINLDYLKNDYDLSIYLIEPEFQEKKELFINLHNLFYKYLKRKKINFNLFTYDNNDFIQKLDSQKNDLLILISLDPFYQLYLPPLDPHLFYQEFLQKLIQENNKFVLQFYLYFSNHFDSVLFQVFE